MLAENPPGLGRLREFIEFIGRPYKRVPNVGAEVPDVVAVAAAKAHADRMAMANLDVAKENLNLAYGALGDKDGKYVTETQIRDVLNAELEVLKTSPNHDPETLSCRVQVMEITEALKFHTVTGSLTASTFMFKKADFWRNSVYDLRVEEPISETGEEKELERRVKACVNASDLLISMSSKIDGST